MTDSGGSTIGANPTQRLASGSGFKAYKKIIPNDDHEKDFTWKKRYDNDLKAWRKRKQREKKLHEFLSSKTMRKFRIVGSAVLVGILVVTAGFVYMERKLMVRSKAAVTAELP